MGHLYHTPVRFEWSPFSSSGTNPTNIFKLQAGDKAYRNVLQRKQDHEDVGILRKELRQSNQEPVCLNSAYRVIFNS